MYYNRLKLYYPDAEYSGGGEVEGGEGEGEGSEGNGRDYGGGDVLDDMGDIIDDKKKKKRKVIITTNSDGSTVINPIAQEEGLKLYNTVSCPCSCYAILSSSGEVSCERDNFGIKEYIQPTILRNHLIENNAPKVGDKWKCSGDVKCNQGNFNWNTLHVVKVEENTAEISSSFVNSRYSTFNCHIPPSALKDHTEDQELLNIDAVNALNDNTFQELINESNLPKTGFDIANPITWIGKKPLYPTKENVFYYTMSHGDSKDVNKYTYFKEGELEGYLPGLDLKDENLITSITVNNKDILNKHLRHDYSESEAIYGSIYDRGKMTIKNIGDIVNVKIKGIGNPTFTLTMEDSSNCTILKKRLRNVVVENGVYELNQKIPTLPNGISSEAYTLKITTGADVRYYIDGEFIQPSQIKMKMYQLSDKTLTVNAAIPGITDTTIVSSILTLKGEASLEKDVSETQTVTVSRGGGGSTDYYYINKSLPSIRDVISKSTFIKKKVFKEENDEKIIESASEIIVVDNFTTDGATVTHAGDVVKGMIFEGSIEKTRNVTKSIDLDIHKEPCEDCDGELNILTNKFELEHTGEIFAPMVVTGKDVNNDHFTTSLVSVDCEKGITLEDEFAINKDTELTFSHKANGLVVKVERTGLGEKLSLSNPIILPRNASITFEKNVNFNIQGHISVDKSGAESLTITTNISSVKFGEENSTLTIDTSLIVTNKPNSCDQYLTVGRGYTHYIDFTRCDIDRNKYDKTITITKEPSHGVVAATTATNVARESVACAFIKTYTPNGDFKGKDTIKFTVSDGENTSEEKTIYLTVK